MGLQPVGSATGPGNVSQPPSGFANAWFAATVAATIIIKAAIKVDVFIVLPVLRDIACARSESFIMITFFS